MEEQLIKTIKNNLKVSNNQRKNKSTRNNYKKKKEKETLNMNKSIPIKS